MRGPPFETNRSRQAKRSLAWPRLASSPPLYPESRSVDYASRRARPLAPRGRHRGAASWENSNELRDEASDTPGGNLPRAVRKELAAKSPAPTTWKGAALKALNSSFGIWFLSTIVIGLVTWSFASYSDYRQAEARKTEAIQKLDTEIAGRLLGARAVVDHMVSRLREGSAFYVRPYVFSEVVNALDMSGGVPRKGVYPELRDRSLRSLLIELRRLASENQQDDLKAATTAYMSLQSHANVGSSGGTVLGTPGTPLPPGTGDTLVSLRFIAEMEPDFDKLLRIARWKLE